MKENYRKNKDDQRILKAEIPPLPIPDISLPESSLIRSKPSKQIARIQKNCLFDQNEEFQKEKSLYSYTAARKFSRNSFNKSQTCLIPNKLLKHNKSELFEKEIEQKNQGIVENKEKSVISKYSTDGQPRGKFFRRRTNNDILNTSFSGIPQKQNLEGTQDQKQRSTSKYSRNNQPLRCKICQNELKPLQNQRNKLKRDIDLLRQENRQLHQIINQKCRELEQAHHKIKVFSEQNVKMMRQIKKSCPVYDQKFIDESKLENELLVRGLLIKDLQQKIKYIELENCTLKKTKKEKEEQTYTISKLQNKNKQLENRIKVMSSLKTKRSKHIKGSMLSSCSEISLNLSVDDEELERLYDVLQSTERTMQQNRDFPKIPKLKHFSSEEEKNKTKLSPWWSPKQTF